MPTEIKAAMSALEARLKAAECTNVNAYALIYSGNVLDDYVTIQYRTSPKSDIQTFCFSGTIEKAIAEANDHIDMLPAPEDRNRAEFYSLISRAAEFGKSIGMDDVLINPLEELAKRLSSNALTGPKATALLLNDEIPF